MLIPEGDPGYIRDMLNQWLKWAPPNHEWPTISALATALRNCEEENLAAKLRANFKQKKGTYSYMYHAWVTIACCSMAFKG